MDIRLAETIEKYHAEYDKNPKSKVFAPLADAYRKLGQHNQALVILKNGLKVHNQFSGGHVVLGRVYDELGQNDKAINSFETAIQLNSNNILAHKMLADLYLKEKDVKKSLACYKMVLFLKPTDKESQLRIQKLESLTADEFSEESFQVKKLNYDPPPRDSAHNEKLLERSLSFADAFLVRNEFEKSFEVLSEARNNLSEHPEVNKRLQLLNENINNRDDSANAHTLANRKSTYINQNIDYLKNLMDRINDRKKN